MGQGNERRKGSDWRKVINRAPMMAVAFAAAVHLCGCKPSTDDDSGPPKPPVVAFTGSADTKFVGNWKSTDGRSGLDMAKDGTVSILAVAATPSGDRKTSLTGSWLFNGTYLLLKYSDKGQAELVIRYTATLSGNTLTLLQVGARKKLVYTKT
jgi:hypothetical protein